MIYFRIQKLSLKYLLLTELGGGTYAQKGRKDRMVQTQSQQSVAPMTLSMQARISSGPVLARIPGSSNLRDTLGSSFHSAVGTLWVLVGRGQAHQGQHEEGGDETHLE